MKNKIVALMLAGCMALSITACGGGEKEAPKNNETKTESTEKEPTKQTDSAKKGEQKIFSEYVGKPLTDLMEKADALGYTATYFADGVEFTEFIDDMKDLYLTGEIKEDTKNKTIEVTLKSKSNAEAEEIQSKLDEKFPEGDAWIAAKHYGQSQYGDDFDLHFLMGKIDASAEDENTWFLKAECSVAGVDMMCEAKVSGTKDNPEIISFDVY